MLIEAGIIYCLARKEVDALAQWLEQEGVRALPYHAGLDDRTRHRHQDAFLNEEADVMVATVAFGMGIDRSDVRFVLHAGAPRSLEHYQQEAGRAGRDGLAAECVLITSTGDFARWRSLLESRGEWSDQVRLLMRDMERYATATSCRHRALVEYFGQRLDAASCGACDWCLGELERVDASASPRPEDPLGRGAHRTTLGRRPRDVGAARRVERGGDGARAPRAVGVRTAEGVLRLRSARLCRSAHAGRLPRAHRATQYPTLQITAAGAELLRGQADCVLFRQPRLAPAERRRALRRAARGAGYSTADDGLFEQLRALRLQLARARGVPPYVIFHDATLRELAHAKPATAGQLLEIPGIGERKAAVYGEAVLKVIAAWSRAEL